MIGHDTHNHAQPAGAFARARRVATGGARRLLAAAGLAQRSVANARPGFTLVELLVAATAVIIIAAGLSQVFRVTGDTVAAGRKLSTLTTYAAAIERQLRLDFGSMTRDGYLLIRSAGVDANQDGQYEPSRIGFATGDAVKLSARDTDPRTRRADEIMLFTNGDYTTLREPRYPTRVAKAHEARVYYGHGRRRTNQLRSFIETTLPLSDNNSLNPSAFPPLGGNEYGPTALGEDIDGNPNRYAADWVLVRHVALLSPPGGVKQDSILATAIGALPPGLVSGLGANLGDSDYQIALQPAAPSIFRRLNDIANLPGPLDVARPDAGTAANVEVPYLSTGIVDIATTSLSEIRSIVLGAPSPTTLTQVGQRFAIEPYQGPANPPPFNPPPANGLTPEQFALQRMQRWMQQGLPADSDGIGGAPPYMPELGLDRRIRTEITPPNFVGFPDVRDYDRTDQLALSASAFVPGCTEFIVEWTFGEIETDPRSPTAGRTIWYGQNRLVDVAQDGALPPVPGSPPTDNFVNYWIRPYTGPDNNLAANDPFNAQKTIKVKRRDGSEFSWPIKREVVSPDPYFNAAYRYNPAAPPETGLYPIYSMFGYIDPTYAPLTPLSEDDLDQRGLTGVTPQADDTVAELAALGYVLVTDRDGDGRYDYNPANTPDQNDVIRRALMRDVNGNGQFDSADGDQLLEPDTVPCAWPKMIRITMSLTDPADPRSEKQFQFVLPVAAPKTSTDF